MASTVRKLLTEFGATDSLPTTRRCTTVAGISPNIRRIPSTSLRAARLKTPAGKSTTKTETTSSSPDQKMQMKCFPGNLAFFISKVTLRFPCFLYFLRLVGRLDSRKSSPDDASLSDSGRIFRLTPAPVYVKEHEMLNLRIGT